MTVSSRGTDLLDLPQEVLHAIFSHIKAHEWAQGPAQSCRLLSKMDLPRLALHLPITRKRPWGGGDRFLAGLRWAAKRVGPSTFWLDLVLSAPNCSYGLVSEKEMISALGSAQQLGQLLCLQTDIYGFENETARCFFVWLLKCVPNLVALNMAEFLWPPPHTFSFQSLRHLQVSADSLQSAFWPAQELPMLQTLCISGFYSSLHEVNLLGCLQLSKLVMNGCSAQRLLREPDCHFSADLTRPSDFLERSWWTPFEGFLHSVCELSLHCQDPFYMSPDSKGLFAGLPRLTMLKVAWPEEEDSGQEPQRDEFVAGAECLLTNCLANCSPSVLSLRTIIITAFSMQARIPGHLPNLEQLVIMAQGSAELSFEDPRATILALKTFYAFGQPLKPDGLDALRMSSALVGTGRALDAVVAQMAGKYFDGGSSCVYLRPAVAEALPMQQLYDLVDRLARGCRCGACFDCLSKAGCLSF